MGKCNWYWSRCGDASARGPACERLAEFAVPSDHPDAALSGRTINSSRKVCCDHHRPNTLKSNWGAPDEPWPQRLGPGKDLCNGACYKVLLGGRICPENPGTRVAPLAVAAA